MSQNKSPDQQSLGEQISGQQSADKQRAEKQRVGKKRTVSLLIFLLIAMVSLGFASVPLYRMFCQATGFGGTPMLAVALPDRILERRVRVRFNVDIAPGLPFRFKAFQREMEVRVGENALAFFEVENLSDADIEGWASYNVVPNKVGAFFAKMQCFCFNSQIIKARDTMQLPVSFFIDPKMSEDASLNDVKTITLSYTFFRYTGQQEF